jgi:hypothetical protein
LPWSQQWRQRFEHRGERVAQRSGGAVDAEVDEDEFADGAFDQGADRGSVPDAHDEVAFLTVQGVVEARRVLIALLGAAGMASGVPAASARVGDGLLGMAARCPVGGWTAD